MDMNTNMDYPKQVTVLARFVTWDESDYDGTLTYDEFTFTVIGTDEREVDFCADAFTNSLTITGSMSDRTYQISEDEYMAEPKGFYLEAKFSGEEDLSSTCKHQYYMALEH
jgi:hypothetical protein